MTDRLTEDEQMDAFVHACSTDPQREKIAELQAEVARLERLVADTQAERDRFRDDLQACERCCREHDAEEEKLEREVAALREALSEICGNQEPSYVREVARAVLGEQDKR